MKNFENSQRSNVRSGASEALLVCVVLSLLVAISIIWCFRHEYILYYGDAQAHLNNSRSVIDSRTPGYDQLGTPWLPMLHVICLPFVSNNWLWSTGLAGSIPVAVCFVIAGLAVYFAAKEAYNNSALAATVVLGCLALNPNILYLAAIPMTEVVFLVGLMTLLFALLRYRRSQGTACLAFGVAASWEMSLTRFDGWFLIPFAAVGFAFFSQRRRATIFLAVGALMALAPLYWMVHNWWEISNPLDFYNGPYSPAAIQGPQRYPGYHDWHVALKFYSKAAQLCAGWPLVVVGILGTISASAQHRWEALLLLVLTPAFYVLSIHSSNTPVWVPQYWFGSYYNIRYGTAIIPPLAFAAGAIVLALPESRRAWAFLIPLLSLAPWMINPSIESVICWKESQHNSVARRAWTAAGARYLAENYHLGEGILLSAGDIMGILCRQQIPLAEGLYIGNGPAWVAATARPDLVHTEQWAIAQAGDPLSKAIARQRLPIYRLWQEILVKGAPALQIYRRDALPFPQSSTAK